jgi:hypothetical protein
MGVLDATGRATAQLVAPPGGAAAFVGSKLTAASATLNPIDFASNPVTILVVP